MFLLFLLAIIFMSSIEILSISYVSKQEIHSQNINIETLPQSQFYDTTTDDCEQALNSICKTIYIKYSNNCGVTEDPNLVWRFLTQNGNVGRLADILRYPQSSTFSCTNPERFGTYLFAQTFNNMQHCLQLGYNINGLNSSKTADLCAISEIVKN